MIGSAVWTWTLPLLLLPLLISFHLSSALNLCRAFRFASNVQELGKYVTACSENCSSFHIEEICKCFNVNMTQRECLSPSYFTEGLKSLHPNITNQQAVKELIKSIPEMIEHCKTNLCSPVLDYEPVLSPKRLHAKLEILSQQINSNMSH